MCIDYVYYVIYLNMNKILNQIKSFRIKSISIILEPYLEF